MISFKGLFYPLKSMQCQVVLQPCASGSSADTIVISNEKGNGKSQTQMMILT